MAQLRLVINKVYENAAIHVLKETFMSECLFKELHFIKIFHLLYVLLIPISPTIASCETPGDYITPQFFGTHVINSRNLQSNIQEMGIKGIRLWDISTSTPKLTFASWRVLEPERGKWNQDAFDLIDRYVDFASHHGMEPLMCLGQTPSWAWPRDYSNRANDQAYTLDYDKFADMWERSKTFSRDSLVLIPEGNKYSLYKSTADNNTERPGTGGGWKAVRTEIEGGSFHTTLGPWVPTTSSGDLDRKAWRDYVYKIGSRYKGKIKYYEVWNEVNLLSFYRGTIEQLAEMTKIASETLKTIDPEIKIIGASITPLPADKLHPFSSTDYLRKYLSLTAAYLDFIGIHPYVNPDPPEKMLDFIRNMRATADSLNNGSENLPLWTTEVGYQGWFDEHNNKHLIATGAKMDRNLSMAYVMRSYLMHAVGGVKSIDLYAMDTFAMPLVVQNKLTDAGVAYKQLVKWLVGRRIDRYSYNNITKIHTVILSDKNGNKETIAWSDDYKQGGNFTHPYTPPEPKGSFYIIKADGSVVTSGSIKSITVSMIPTLFSARRDISNNPEVTNFGVTDSSPPTGSIKISSCDYESHKCMLQLRAGSEAVPGGTASIKMRFSKNNKVWTDPEDFKSQRTIGICTNPADIYCTNVKDNCLAVFYQLIDSNNKRSETYVTFTNAAGPMTIDMCKATTSSADDNIININQDQILDFNGNPFKPTYMNISKDNIVWNGWEPFSPQRRISKLDFGRDRIANIYIKFKDDYGVNSPVYNDSIRYADK